MHTQWLTSHCSNALFHRPRPGQHSSVFVKKSSFSLIKPSLQSSNLHLVLPGVKSRSRVVASCSSPDEEVASAPSFRGAGGGEDQEEEAGNEVKRVSGLEDQTLWEQMKEIVMFTGPATGLWICGPLMSMIDTAVIGQGSSIELAALGPGTVLCDNLSYVFMFLSIATSNMVATSLAKQDKEEVQHQLSVLLFIGLTCGSVMFAFTKFFGPTLLAAFAGSNSLHIVPAANKYAQIRALAWPAILVGWVAQSASLGMKDSWGPLKALAIASVVNGIGDIVLCRFFDFGIAGAAWATMASQVIAAFMMLNSLSKKGYDAYAVSVPSFADLATIFVIAAPVFIMMISKVAFYTLLVYFATSTGTLTLAAHQVMIQVFFTCTVWGEPLSQTAQSFMPELLFGVNRSLSKARMLLKSLVIIGAIVGLTLGVFGSSVPWLFPTIFTPDQLVIREMHRVLPQFFMGLVVTPCILCFEGTLLAGRDLRFISLAMSGCFSLGTLLLVFVKNSGFGLPGFWSALVAFQWARFFLVLQRLLSPSGILFAGPMSPNELQKLKAV